jgi:hypothetical protein
MPTIRARIYGPGKESVARKKAPPGLHTKLVSLFRDLLAKQPKDAKIFFGSKDFEKTFIEFKTVGPSSAICVWKRAVSGGVQLADKAVSIFMGGDNPAADAKVLAGLRRLGNKLSYPAKIYQEMETDRRPLIATLFLDRASFEEPMFPIAAEALSVAFFEKLIRKTASPPKRGG